MDAEPPPVLARRPLRLLVGLGAGTRERALLGALRGLGDVHIVRQCLSADQVLAAAAAGSMDAILLSESLHRLTRATLAQLQRTRSRLVLMVAQPGPEHWAWGRATLVSRDSPAAAVRQACAVIGPAPMAWAEDPVYRVQEPRMAPPRPSAAPSTTPATAQHDGVPSPALPAPMAFIPAVGQERAIVFTVAGGPSAPGRTTVALNLATALGLVAPTLLVEADVAGPRLQTLLEVDPSRNLAVLAHAEPQSPEEWDQALRRETQRLHVHSPHARLLLGIPKVELRPGVPPRLVEQLLAHARQRYRFVVVDMSADLLGPDAAVHRAALASADQVLLVAAPDVPGIWAARSTQRLLQSQAGVPVERIALVLNGHHPRLHHPIADLEWELGAMAAAVVPLDVRGCAHAVTAQRPIVLDRNSRAGRALLALATLAYDGAITLPTAAPHRRRLPAWTMPRLRLPWRRARAAVGQEKTQQEVLHV